MQQKGMSVLGGMSVLLDSLVDIRVEDEELLGLIPQFSSVVLQYTTRLSRTRNTNLHIPTDPRVQRRLPGHQDSCTV